MRAFARWVTVLLAILLLAPGFTMGHRGGPVEEGVKGLPKNYCENSITQWWTGEYFASSTWDGFSPLDRDFHDYAEVRTHDYGAPAAGVLAFNGGLPGVPDSVRDGNTQGDCDGNGLGGDFDRHFEYAHGGAVLLARNESLDVDINGDGIPDVSGAGVPACWNGLWADHEEANPEMHTNVSVYVNDVVWGAAIGFLVSSNWARVASGDPCGDAIVEPCNDPGDIDQVTCNSLDRTLRVAPDHSGLVQENVGVVNFRAGANGAYSVFIGALDAPGTIGHVGTQSDISKKKPNVPTGAFLPNVLLAAFIQDRPNGPVRLAVVGPNCVGSRDGPWNPNAAIPNFAKGDNVASVTCAWDFKTSCSGTVIATNVGGPGDVRGRVTCGAANLAAAVAVPPPGPSWAVASGQHLGSHKAWGCDARFDVVPPSATRGVVLCLAPLQTGGLVNGLVNGLSP